MQVISLYKWRPYYTVCMLLEYALTFYENNAHSSLLLQQ